ncbi:hypothetical protein [Tritonibacter multivorans]|uniref:hypothetical protein n=1 Tax=Tritonibacter multivorans TaxID=928856 RepID=UPI00071C2986|nr:hypothetical protein [Tritonibacter multivorans]MDA7419757.1 hypothetical protein [Tritonibacter multivorans]
MLVKIVTFFLIGMAVLAMFGRLRFPGQKKLNSARCSKCGRFKIGKGPCDCKGKPGKKGDPRS